MKDLRLFGTEAFMLHPSHLRNLLICPLRVVMEYLSPGEGRSGPAADTGSAMHAAAAAWHLGANVAEAIAEMTRRSAEYPLADLGDATNLFLCYAADERNSSAKVLYVEEPIRFNIAPSPNDPTGQPICVVGTCDQLREDERGLMVVDLKTSKLDPMDVMAGSTHQIAAYVVGMSVRVGRPVERACLVMPRRYTANLSQSPVFWHFAWRFRDAEAILDGVRDEVARVRSGKLRHMPTSECRWCALRSPDVCLPQMQKTLQLIGAMHT